MKLKLNIVLVAIMALALSACTSSKKDQGTLVNPDSSTVGQNSDNANALASNAFGSGYSVEDLKNRFGIDGNPLNYNTVYFAYNSSDLDERSRIIAAAHAKNAAAKGGASIVLEGNTDNRGTRAYNLHLGERRAQSVASFMSSVGAGNSSIKNVSYGEERAVDASNNESAWAKNRRVDIVISF